MYVCMYTRHLWNPLEVAEAAGPVAPDGSRAARAAIGQSRLCWGVQMGFMQSDTSRIVTLAHKE